MNIVIVGRGRVGSALRRSFERHPDFRVATAGRRRTPARVRAADVIILAVSDDVIESVAQEIAPHVDGSTTVFHCAGARSADELGACAARGAAVGVLHPLISFPNARRSPSLTGKTFVVNGSPRAVAVSRRLAKACGVHVVVADTRDPAYHASAALAANGAAALAFVSVGVLERLGFSKRDAERAVGGLLESVGHNVQRLGVPGALTGPIARGDAETVQRHRRALRRIGRRALSTYDAVVPVIVHCARAAGLPQNKASKILGLSKTR